MIDMVFEVEKSLRRLHQAISTGKDYEYCLRLWSQFIRNRDDNVCVVCGQDEDLAAHHIIRKSFLKMASLQSGNGITLCRPCHKMPHEKFNRRPNLLEPMDAENGEKIEIITELFEILLGDACKRDMPLESFYHLDKAIIDMCKKLQGFDPDTFFRGESLEQMCLIWKQTPHQTLRSLLKANGVDVPKNFVQQGPLTIFQTRPDERGESHSIHYFNFHDAENFPASIRLQMPRLRRLDKQRGFLMALIRARYEILDDEIPKIN